jgi:hypothetical protein
MSVIQAPPKLTKDEEAEIKRCFVLSDNEFNMIFNNSYTRLIEEAFVTRDEEGIAEYACVYVTDAVRGDSGQKTIFGYYARFQNTCYRAGSLFDTVSIINLLKKQEAYWQWVFQQDKLKTNPLFRKPNYALSEIFPRARALTAGLLLINKFGRQNSIKF